MDIKWTSGNELEYLRQVLENSSEVRKNPFTDRLEKAFINRYGTEKEILEKVNREIERCRDVEGIF